MAEVIGNIAGIILAAGEGKRIGGNKALLRITGVSFLELMSKSLIDCGCKPIIVVVGAEAGKVRETAKDLTVNFVENKNWHEGQFSSLKAGLVTLPPEIPGALVNLIDHPMVKKETYKLIYEIFLEDLDKIIIPIYGGKRGHPILIPASIINEIIHSSDDLNLRDIIKLHIHLVFEQMVDDPGVLLDIDTPDDLEKINQ